MSKIDILFLVSVIFIVILLAVFDISLFIVYFMLSFLFLIKLFLLKIKESKKENDFSVTKFDHIFSFIMISSFLILGILELFF